MNSQSTPASVAPAETIVSTVPVLEPLTYSVTETATVLGVSLPTVYRLLARGILRPLPGLRHKRLPKKQVHAFVEGGRSTDW
ncbi:MAG TPA: helix-turn-helix domain-containing protein [Opitutaceae bacterium]|nr:helix-turn-helix domain-containing protein [Opitutaceae bacterium]